MCRRILERLAKVVRARELLAVRADDDCADGDLALARRGVGLFERDAHPAFVVHDSTGF